MVLGVLIYKGAVRLNLATFFRWTGALLVIVAAGVLAYAIHDLQEAGALPGLNSLAFDVSEQIPPASWYGTLLKGSVNFSPATTRLEALAWVLYVVPVLYLFIRGVRRPQGTRARRRHRPPNHEEHPVMKLRTLALPGLVLLVAGAACTDNDSGDDDNAAGGDTGRLTVASSDDVCDVSATEAPSGNLVFSVRTRARRSRSSTSSARTASASSARSRTSARA